MKRKNAKEILAESFREIAAKNTVDKITVTDIVKNCGYSSATFYRQFKDKYDLMAWEYIQRLEPILNKKVRTPDDWKRICRSGAMFFHEQKEYLKNLLLHTSGHDSFVRNMKMIHFECLKNWILDALNTDELDAKTEMCARCYCHGAVDLTCDWVMGSHKMSPEMLAEVYENSLPFPLHQYLCKLGID